MDFCEACHKKIAYQMTTCIQLIEGRLIVIENVRAWVCDQCGETFYDPDVVERIQNIIWSNEAPVRIIEAPVYDLGA